MGRKAMMTEEDAERWLALLGEGMTKREAAAAIGAPISRFRWRYDHDPAFRRATDRAVREGAKVKKLVSRSTTKAMVRTDAALQARVDDALRGLVNYSDAARILGVSREAVRNMARKGTLPRVDTPAGPLVTVDRELPPRSGLTVAARWCRTCNAYRNPGHRKGHQP